MKKKSILPFLITGIIIIASLCINLKPKKSEIPVVRYEAIIPIYDTAEELEQKSDLIVIGSVKTDLEDDKVFLNDFDNDGDIEERLTISKFYIQKILKGECNERVIDLVQPAAISTNGKGEKCKFVLDRYEELNKSDLYLLYLVKTHDSNKDILGEYSLGPTGVYQGVINLSKNLPIPENKGDESRERKRPEFPEERHGHDAAADIAASAGGGGPRCGHRL